MRTSRKADGRPAFQFYPDDWLGETSLRVCPLADRGLWMDMLCVMWVAPRRGFLQAGASRVEAEGLARIAGATEAEVEQSLSRMEAAGVFERDSDGTIYCRRMVREEKQRLSKVQAGRAGGIASKRQAEPQAKRGSSSSSSSPTPSSEDEDTVASAAAPPSATAASGRDAQRAQEADALTDQLVEAATRYEPAAGAVCRIYLEEAERGLAAWYEKRGGLWTPTRRRNWLLRLQRVAGTQPAAVLAALELYIDDHAGGKDEAYVVGIARRLARTLETEPAAFDAEMDRHRRRNKQGALAIAQEAIDDLAKDIEAPLAAAQLAEAGRAH